MMRTMHPVYRMHDIGGGDCGLRNKPSWAPRVPSNYFRRRASAMGQGPLWSMTTSCYGADADNMPQADIRNEIVTARMYIADMEYNYYEARLTREMQDEGLLATATELGLTTAATLVPVAQTKTLLSALATGVVGLDKAYTEKELLSNTHSSFANANAGGSENGGGRHIRQDVQRYLVATRGK